MSESALAFSFRNHFALLPTCRFSRYDAAAKPLHSKICLQLTESYKLQLSSEFTVSTPSRKTLFFRCCKHAINSVSFLQLNLLLQRPIVLRRLVPCESAWYTGQQRFPRPAVCPYLWLVMQLELAALSRLLCPQLMQRDKQRFCALYEPCFRISPQPRADTRLCQVADLLRHCCYC